MAMRVSGTVQLCGGAAFLQLAPAASCAPAAQEGRKARPPTQEFVSLIERGEIQVHRTRSESDKESSDQESAEKGSEESSSESSSTSSPTCKSQLRRTIAELRGTVQEFEEAIAVHQSIQDENDDLSILVDDLHDENIAFRAEIRQLRAKFEA
eukprot:Skav211283  [mRNA]  locus=scaffold2429:142500:143053:+ [translate_table: standard]